MHTPLGCPVVRARQPFNPCRTVGFVTDTTLMPLTSQTSTVEHGHLKQRYSSRKVCRIFGIHEDTLNNWLREGVRLANGRRIRIHYIPIGRKKEFEVEEIERVYQELRASSVEEADVLPFPDESDRDERRAARRKL